MTKQALPITIKGVITKGWQRGRELGFPTVNITLPTGLESPEQGIYAGTINIDSEKYRNHTFLAACSTGYNTTFNADKPTIEAHIIDFDDDIYGKTVTLTLTHYIRDMVKFDTVDDLVAQIKQDVVDVKQHYADVGGF